MLWNIHVKFKLWLEKTCSVIFGYNDTVCLDLTNETWSDEQNDVQKKVTFKSVMP